MNIDFSKFFQKLLPFAYLILCSYFIATILFIYLPKNGIDFVKESSSNLDYKKYDFYSTIKKIDEQQNIQSQNNKSIQTLDKYELKAIYSTTNNKGWINIEEKSGNESYVLSFRDEIDGYKLEKIDKNYVIFIKNGKEYKLEIKDKEISNFDMNQTKNQNNQEIEIKNNGAVINRNYLNSYVSNIDKIWKDISIKEIKNGEKIEGFKIEKISKDSVFGKLGLKERDILKSVNNSELNSYAKAFEIFNNLENIEYLNMEVLRNNEIVELNYEIN